MLEEAMPLSSDAKELLNKAAERMKLSARSYYRLIRVARTIADLEGDLGDIKQPHIAESLSYRKINLIY
jgi:magnesium chelatase family protein